MKLAQYIEHVAKKLLKYLHFQVSSLFSKYKTLY